MSLSAPSEKEVKASMLNKTLKNKLILAAYSFKFSVIDNANADF